MFQRLLDARGRRVRSRLGLWRVLFAIAVAAAACGTEDPGSDGQPAAARASSCTEIHARITELLTQGARQGASAPAADVRQHRAALAEALAAASDCGPWSEQDLDCALSAADADGVRACGQTVDHSQHPQGGR